jgi:hypothetical protein
MPRGVKKNIDDRIAEIDKVIEAHKNKLDDLKAERKALLEARELERTSELLKIIDESGMSTDQLIELVKKSK